MRENTDKDLGNASKTRPALSAVSPRRASEDAAAIAIAPSRDATERGWVSDCCGRQSNEHDLNNGICPACHDHTCFTRYDEDGKLTDVHT